MRPNTQYPPTCLEQQSIGQTVSRNISSNFVLPIQSIIVWHPKMPAAAVPEAPVNEDSEAFTAKDKIRATWQRLVTPPACNMVGAENCDQFQLRVSVPFRTDGSHYPGAFFSGENVCHKATLAARMDASSFMLLAVFCGWRMFRQID